VCSIGFRAIGVKDPGVVAKSAHKFADDCGDNSPLLNMQLAHKRQRFSADPPSDNNPTTIRKSPSNKHGGERITESGVAKLKSGKLNSNNK
jgi:hypothetical protein